MQPTFCRLPRHVRSIACAFALAAIASPATASGDLERHRAPFHGQMTDYFVRGGMAIAHGDIILGTAAELAAARQLSESAARAATDAKALTINNPNLLWLPGPSGVIEVPYIITAGPQANITQALTTFNLQLAGVMQWVPRTAQADYVNFNLADQSTVSCFSSVGRVGGAQQITGLSSCSARGILHEMGHAVGLWHVQEDPAATSFLQVRFDAMDPRWRSQYRPLINSRTIDGYDYASIMHYSSVVQSVTPDNLTAGTLPFGIDIGLGTTLSAADVDAIVRLYGATRASVTVSTNPEGLDVIVDGVRVTAPAAFNWKLGSLHRIDVPAGLQTSNGFSYGFGRWSHDPGAMPVAAQEWIVESGSGEFAEPMGRPKTGVLTANFVRLIQVSNPVTNGQLGQFAKTTDQNPSPGTTDLYPAGTLFSLTGTPNAGAFSVPVNSGAISARTGISGPAGVTAATWRLTAGATSASLGWAFVSGPALLVNADGDGFDNPRFVSTMTLPGAAAASRVTPTVLTSASGGNATIVPLQTLTRSESVQHVLGGTTGFDDPATGRVQIPSGVQPTRTVTLHYNKQFKPVLTRVPACGGSLSLSDASLWLDVGESVIATATPTAPAVFAGWGGTLAGMNPVQSFTVDKVHEVTAYFNSTAERVSIATISPAVFTRGQGPVQFTITGTGFTANMRVLVNNTNQVTAVQLVDAHTLRVTLSDAQFPNAGRAAVRVGSIITQSCVADSDDLMVEVRQAAQPQQIEVFEFYNAVLNRYFRTAVAEEAAAIRANPATGEQDTGQTFKAWSPSAHPPSAKKVCRFYGSVSPGPNSHFFTSDVDECRALQRQELDTAASLKRWNYEELAFAVVVPVNGVCPAEAPVEVRRVYNNGFLRGIDSNHRLILDIALYDQMIATGDWLPEGIVMCASS